MPTSMSSSPASSSTSFPTSVRHSMSGSGWSFRAATSARTSGITSVAWGSSASSGMRRWLSTPRRQRPISGHSRARALGSWSPSSRPPGSSPSRLGRSPSRRSSPISTTYGSPFSAGPAGPGIPRHSGRRPSRGHPRAPPASRRAGARRLDPLRSQRLGGPSPRAHGASRRSQGSLPWTRSAPLVSEASVQDGRPQ